MGTCRRKHPVRKRKKKHCKCGRTSPTNYTGTQNEEQASPSLPVTESPASYWAPLWIERIPDWAVQPVEGGRSYGMHHSGGSHGMHHSDRSHGKHHSGRSHGMHQSGRSYGTHRTGGSSGWI